MPEQDKSASETRDIPAFLRHDSVQPLSLPSKEARYSAGSYDSGHRSALARQGSMSKLHGPREAGSPSKTRKSVTFDYQDEVIQYDVQTPEPRYTPDPDYSQFDVHSHPLPALPSEFDDFGANQANNMGRFTEDIDEDERQKSDSPSNVTLGWDDEIPAPASPNPLMAELDESRPRLSKRIEAVMEEAPELSKKPFVRTHRSNASWGSQTLREGLHAVSPSPLIDASADENSEDEGHHLDRLPSLIRQESLLEDQRRPHTVRMSQQSIPAPSEVQRTYSQRRKALLKMLDANKPHVPDAIVEEEDEVATMPLSVSTTDLFNRESLVVGIDPGSPQRETPQQLLASMSSMRDSIEIPDLSHTDAGYFGVSQEPAHEEVKREVQEHAKLVVVESPEVIDKVEPQKELEELAEVSPKSLEPIQEAQEASPLEETKSDKEVKKTVEVETVQVIQESAAPEPVVAEPAVTEPAAAVPEEPVHDTKAKRKSRNRKRSKAKGRNDAAETAEAAVEAPIRAESAPGDINKALPEEPSVTPAEEPARLDKEKEPEMPLQTDNVAEIEEPAGPQLDSEAVPIVNSSDLPSMATVSRRPLPVIGAAMADEPIVEHPESPVVPMQEIGSPEVKLESYHGTPVLAEMTGTFRENSVARRLAAVKEVESPEVDTGAMASQVAEHEAPMVETDHADAPAEPVQDIEPEKIETATALETNWASIDDDLVVPQHAKEVTVEEDTNKLGEVDLPVVEEKAVEPQESLQFAPVDLGDTPNLGTISASPFMLSMPGTPATNMVSPTQAEIERREYLVRQTELRRIANETAQRPEPIEESFEEAEQVSPESNVDEGSPDFNVAEKQNKESPVIAPPHLDSDLSDSEMSSPEIRQLQPAAEIPEPVTIASPAIANAPFSRAPPISTSTLSVETGDSLQNMSSEFEQLLTPRRGYTVRESPTYVMASSPTRQRSTPVRRNGALEIGAGPHIPQAASCGQISHASPRRIPQSASASPVRVPEHSRRSRPVWMATAPPLQEEPEVAVPEPVAIQSPAQPVAALATFSSSPLMGSVESNTSPLRELTPPLAPSRSESPMKERPMSEIHVPRVRPSRELLNEQYKQLPPQDALTETPPRGSDLLHSSPAVRKSKSPKKFAGRIATSLHETGRLFIRVDSAAAWLPDVVSRTCQVWLELDNGEHCITTPCAHVIGDSARFGKEYELVVGPEESVTVTTHIKWESSGPTSNTLLSKLRRKQPEVDWQRLVAADGAFGRCTLNFADLAATALGKPTSVAVELINEWTGGKGGKIELTTLFVPRMSAKESLPATMEDAVNQIEAAQRAAIARKTGPLVVNGKSRWCLVDDASLVVYSEARRPRASFNLNKATSCEPSGQSVSLEFRTGDVLVLEADSAVAAQEWSRELAKTIATPTIRSPWLNLVLYR